MYEGLKKDVIISVLVGTLFIPISHIPIYMGLCSILKRI